MDIIVCVKRVPETAEADIVVDETAKDIKTAGLVFDINEWDNEQLNDAKSHDVFEDLQKTAPILWIDGEKKIGYLRIRKWLQDIEKQD